MGGVSVPGEFSSGFSGKVQKQRLLCQVRERNVASLFFVIPDFIFTVDVSAETCCARNRKLVVAADATIECAVKKFCRFSEFAVFEGNAPGGTFFPRGFVFVDFRAGDVNDGGVRTVDAPARDGGAFFVELDGGGVFVI